MHALAHGKVVLFILEQLNIVSQIAQLALSRDKSLLVGQVEHTVHVEAQHLVGQHRELVAEAVRVPAILVRNEVICTGILSQVLIQQVALRVFDTRVNVEVTAAGHLVCQGHLIPNVHVLEEAVLGSWKHIDRVRPC